MYKIRVRNLERQQAALVRLIAFAEKHGFIPALNGGFQSPVIQEFVQLFTNGANGAPLSRKELARLTDLTQTLVSLPVYTTAQAAAWLGVGIDAVRDAVWKSDPPTLKTFKPGHDVLVSHGELVRFSEG